MESQQDVKRGSPATTIEDAPGSVGSMVAAAKVLWSEVVYSMFVSCVVDGLWSGMLMLCRRNGLRVVSMLSSM